MQYPLIFKIILSFYLYHISIILLYLTSNVIIWDHRCEKSIKVAIMYFPVQPKIPQKFLYHRDFDFCHTKFYNLQATN